MSNRIFRLLGAWRAGAYIGALCWLSLMASANVVRADLPISQRLSLRYSAGASLMLSSDQRAWLDYSAPGLLTDLQLALRLTPLFSAQLGVAGGVFFSPSANGAVLAPMIGGTLHWSLAGVPSYLALNLGAAVTGQLVRLFARAALGIDWALSSLLSAGPVLGVDVVTQADGALYSTDAIYGWLGLALSFRPVRGGSPARSHKPLRAAPEPQLSAAEPKAPSIELEPAREPTPPSAEISALIDEAVHVSHTELLAPVLFEYDSVELEPSSVAMLHEVARLLNQERRDIQLLGVLAYADGRGPADYNLALSARRAQHVRSWLVAHGVADQRLSVEARGASDPVEVGEAADQQQNRRVVFRVLRVEQRP